MGDVVIDMSMSLDGYIAAPNDVPGDGLGEDGMRLHNWAFDDPAVMDRVFGNLTEETGAVIMGRRSYDNSIESGAARARWATSRASSSPIGPSTRSIRLHSRDRWDRKRPHEGEGGRWRQADRPHGRGCPRQFIAAGLVDEIRIHLVDVLLGGGRRLFDTLPERVELKQTELYEAGGVAHLGYRVMRSRA